MGEFLFIVAIACVVLLACAIPSSGDGDGW